MTTTNETELYIPVKWQIVQNVFFSHIFMFFTKDTPKGIASFHQLCCYS